MAALTTSCPRVISGSTLVMSFAFSLRCPTPLPASPCLRIHRWSSTPSLARLASARASSGWIRCSRGNPSCQMAHDCARLAAAHASSCPSAPPAFCSRWLPQAHAPRIPHSAHADSPLAARAFLPAACTQPASPPKRSERPHRRRDAAHQASAQGTARGALREIEQENASLQEQTAAQPALQALGRDRRMQGPRREDGHKLRALASGQRVRRSDERADEKNGRTMRRHASGLFAVLAESGRPLQAAQMPGLVLAPQDAHASEVAVSRAGPWRVAIRSGAANATVGASDGTPCRSLPQFRHLSFLVFMGPAGHDYGGSV